MKVIDLLVEVEQKKYKEEFRFFVHISKLIYSKNSKESNINWTCKDGLIYNSDDVSTRFYHFLENGVYKLSDEVEIIEEDKEIKKLDINYIDNSLNGKKHCEYKIELLAERLNEIIDEINKLKEK